MVLNPIKPTTLKKAFTIIELVVVLVIIGLLAAFAVPSYNAFMQQGAGENAQSNLMTIYQAQRSYFFKNYSNFCLDTSTAPCNNLANINTNLPSRIVDTQFNYTCTSDPSGYICTATNISNPGFQLTITNNPIVLPGAQNCTASNQSGCNPSCVNPSNPSYCPTNQSS
ncbi:MAG: type II secretion system protein [Candidatus Omnitrophica bacterium]|nr:type II secretion system protein [Candidatus Omnitrophota bacterium]